MSGVRGEQLRVSSQEAVKNADALFTARLLNPTTSPGIQHVLEYLGQTGDTAPNGITDLKLGLIQGKDDPLRTDVLLWAHQQGHTNPEKGSRLFKKYPLFTGVMVGVPGPIERSALYTPSDELIRLAGKVLRHPEPFESDFINQAITPAIKGLAGAVVDEVVYASDAMRSVLESGEGVIGANGWIVPNTER